MPIPTAVATLNTNLGPIKVDLYGDHAPKTVKNFVGLATGEIEWTHPATGEKSTDPLYDGVVFHRIIPDFMIQGGDPLGQGIGGPGYQFDDEINSELDFTEPYVLAMANAGIQGGPRHQRLAVLHHRRPHHLAAGQAHHLRQGRRTPRARPSSTSSASCHRRSRPPARRRRHREHHDRAGLTLR